MVSYSSSSRKRLLNLVLATKILSGTDISTTFYWTKKCLTLAMQGHEISPSSQKAESQKMISQIELMVKQAASCSDVIVG